MNSLYPFSDQTIATPFGESSFYHLFHSLLNIIHSKERLDIKIDQTSNCFEYGYNRLCVAQARASSPGGSLGGFGWECAAGGPWNP